MKTTYTRRLPLILGFSTLLLLPVLWSQMVQAAPTVQVLNGRTTVNLSNDFVNTLVTNGITPNDIKPGNLKGAVASFPIPRYGGGLDFGAVPPIGDIFHAGGLTLTGLGTEVKLFNFIIDTDTGKLTGLVAANDSVVARVPLFNLDFSAAEIKALGTRILIRNVGLKLTDEAAAALNSLFAPVFSGGFDIGVAKVYLRLPSE